MVLRGSKTQPNNLHAAYAGMRAAELELRQIEDELQRELLKKEGMCVHRVNGGMF